MWDDHVYFPNRGDESRTRPEPRYRDSFYPGAKPELRPQDEFRSREKYFMELAVFIDRDLHRCGIFNNLFLSKQPYPG